MAELILEQLDVEEQLFIGVFQGNPREYEDQLRSLGDVDVRNFSQRTLLHMAVRTGRFDWVESLLGMGADVFITDRENATALEMAKAMVARYPEEEVRGKILKLIQLVVDREIAKRRNDDDGCAVVVESSLAEPERLDKPVLLELLATVSTLSEEVASIGESVERLHQQSSERHESIVGEIDEIKVALVSRDTLLEKLETSVTSLVGELSPPEKFSNETDLREGEGSGDELEGVRGRSLVKIAPLSISANDEEMIRVHCIDEMIRRTELLKRNEDYIALVRDVYNRIYSTSPLLSTMLQFLHIQPDFQVAVDCDNWNIQRIKKKIKDINGYIQEGFNFCGYADFNENVVYAGLLSSKSNTSEMVIGNFAIALMQMAIYLAFNNEGRPYENGDDKHCKEYKEIIENMEKQWYDNGGFETQITRTLSNSGNTEKEVFMIGAVAGMLAYYGPTDGELRVRRKMRSLVKYCEDNVVTTLLTKMKVNN